MRQLVVRFLCVVSLFASSATFAGAQLTAQPIITGLPGGGLVAFVQDPAIANTFYLVQRSGVIRVLQNGSLLDPPFLDLRGKVTTGGERGLLGMAFQPGRPERVFVHFTNLNGDIVIARFKKDDANSHVVAPGSPKELVWPNDQPFIKHSTYDNHNGGQLAFGPDGFLYIGLGDGGGGAGDDELGNAQNPTTLLGKMLRIDVNVLDDHPQGYVVPLSNPFVSFAGQVLTEIWDFGLRNPWRYSFDNVALGGTGALIIADVGQQAREEIDYEPAGRGGRNYGWPRFEGSIPNPGAGKPMVPLAPVNPVIDYPRAIGGSITGGYVYRGAALPATFRGRYFVADFSSGLVASVGLNMNPATQEATFADALDHTAALGGDRFRIVSFAEDASGELYIVRISGSVHKIVTAPAMVPNAPVGFTHTIVGSTVQLSWQAPTAPLPTSYRLEVGSSSGAFDLLMTSLPGTATSLGPTGVADGRYFVRLYGVNGVGTGPASAELDIRVGCTGPPPAPAFFTHGDANPKSGNVVTLAWGNSAGATEYVLEVGSQPGATDILIARLGPVTALTTVAPPGTYHVRIRAQNTCGVSAPTPAPIPVVIDNP